MPYTRKWRCPECANVDELPTGPLWGWRCSSCAFTAYLDDGTLRVVTGTGDTPTGGTPNRSERIALRLVTPCD